MTEQVNLNLREYVTSVGFQLTLSKRMIDLLVALDHFQGDFQALSNWENEGNEEGKNPNRVAFRRGLFAHYVTSFHALEARGLVRREIRYTKGLVDRDKTRHRLTRAGKLTISLLKEAGIYAERIKEMGLG